MQTTLAFLISASILTQGTLAAPLHNLPSFANAVAQTTYKDKSCGEQAGSCVIQPQYQATPEIMKYSYAQPQVMPVYQQSEEQPEGEGSTFDQDQVEQAPAEDTQGAEQPTDESTPDQGQMEEAPAEDDQSQSEDQSQDIPSSSATPTSWNLNMSQLQPKQALLDEVKGHASQGSQALSNSNQFDQAQLVDQTIYQPAQPPQPQIIIPQWPMHRPRRAYKKYKKFAHRSFKIRYFSGNRH
ncbi:hypothetical protein K7432_013202 [Basidiobolus ranarum]|uniref:Uncharacterized protein n=1 Tax=Basidiobolus ranarum TaxID=34480 RepID=A0ABR2WJP1_9FUNG